MIADAISATPLVSTNIQVVLAFIVVVLAGVVVYQNRKIEKLYSDKDNVQEKRLQDKIDVIDKYNEAMGETSRTVELLTSKLKAGG